jgi:uncharacterized membrane protein YoaK (UPF0700 family)
MSAPAERLTRGVSTPSIDSSLGTKLLPTLLSVIAKSVDAIGFLGLGGLFTAHVTGNLVILAAHLASGGEAPVAIGLRSLALPTGLALLALAMGLAANLHDGQGS